MRIALITPEFLPPWGGVGIYAYELVRALAQREELEIHVIAPERDAAYTPKRVRQMLGKNVHMHYLSKANGTFFYNLTFQLAVWRKFSKLNKRYKFDIVHATNLVHMPDIFLKFKKWDVPFVATIHSTLDGQSKVNGLKRHLSASMAPVEIMSRLAYPYIKTMQQAYIKRTENFICVSRWVKKLAGVKAEVIHNGVDVQRFRPKQAKNKLPVVLYVGRLLAMKGIDTLLDASRPLLKEGRMRLVLAGPGNAEMYRKRLEGVDKEFYDFKGEVGYEKIHKLYQQADIFVMPSLTESFPFVVLEAMSSGLAVVATKVGGVPEMLDSKTGIMVRPGDAEALRRGLKRVIDDNKLRQTLGRSARDKVTKNFSTTTMADKTLAVYRRII